MEKKLNRLSRFSPFRIVLFYVVVSVIYIYSSDYLLKMMVSDIELLSKIQTYKGLGFVLITAALLFALVKRNIDTVSAYYKQVIVMKQEAADQVKNSRQQYISLFNQSPLPMWLFDIESLQFLMVNDATCRIYGYTREEFSSMTIKDIRPPEYIPMMGEILAKTLTSPYYSVAETLHHRKKMARLYW